MANYNLVLYPLLEMMPQQLTTSLDDGLERFAGYAPFDLSDFTPFVLDSITHAGSTAMTSHAVDLFIVPTWVDNLFGHILVVPSRLDMGNLLSNQVRTVEVANLFLTNLTLDAIANNAGGGLAFANLPALPHDIVPFGSFILQVQVSVGGPPSINGTIDFDFDSIDSISVPVTGRRIVMFPWQPETPIEEELHFETTVLESRNASEQRISILIAARQKLSFKVIFDDPLAAARMRNTTFDWLARIWGVPIWFEQRYIIAEVQSGDLIVEVDTRFGDFRVGGLACLIDRDGYFESFEIESMTDSDITFSSGAIRDFSLQTRMMPVRTAYAGTQPTQSRYAVGVESIDISFTSLDNIDLSDVTGQAVFNGKMIFKDNNYMEGSLSEGMNIPVTMFDNKTGRLYQVTRNDRSRLFSRKQWKTKTLEDLWRIRRLTHALRGSQVGFYLPSFRPDFQVVDTIGPGAQSMEVANVGYTTYVGGRNPLAAVRILLKNGTEIIRKIVDSDELPGGETEQINVEGVISATALAPAAIYRVELVWLVRIADDVVRMTHKSGHETITSINVISIKA